MPNYICQTCGAHYAEHSTPPRGCKICEDERQYVHREGQSWTTLTEATAKHDLVIRPMESNLYGIGIEPSFAIGQRALLLRSSQGNILWDCIPLINDQIIQQIKKLGGLDMIAISHPHYYTGLSEWSKAFGGIPIYLHEDDREWVTRPDKNIVHWSGEQLSLLNELTLIRCGGHFDGGVVLHWPQGAEVKGVLLTGDIIQAIPDRRFVSFMYSYPNFIPLAVHAIQKIEKAVSPFSFDRIYSAWWDSCIDTDAKSVIERSVSRYIRAIS